VTEINLRFIRKNNGSGVSGCESISEAIDADGGHYVVGKLLTGTAATSAAAQLAAAGSPVADDEAIVRVPAGVILDSGS
jgi:hypothetical protein